MSKTATFYAVIHQGSVWGIGDTPEEARQATHEESQKLREATDDGPPESIEEDKVLQDSVLVTMSCPFDQREALADFINGWK